MAVFDMRLHPLGLPSEGEAFYPRHCCCSTARLPPIHRRPLSFAPPPHDGFAFLASAHTDALGCRHILYVLVMNAPYNESQSYAIPLGENIHTEVVLRVDVPHRWFHTEG